MSKEIPEADWQVLKSKKPRILNTACQRALYKILTRITIGLFTILIIPMNCYAEMLHSYSDGFFRKNKPFVLSLQSGNGTEYLNLINNKLGESSNDEENKSGHHKDVTGICLFIALDVVLSGLAREWPDEVGALLILGSVVPVDSDVDTFIKTAVLMAGLGVYNLLDNNEDDDSRNRRCITNLVALPIGVVLLGYIGSSKHTAKIQNKSYNIAVSVSTDQILYSINWRY